MAALGSEFADGERVADHAPTSTLWRCQQEHVVDGQTATVIISTTIADTPLKSKTFRFMQ